MKVSGDFDMRRLIAIALALPMFAAVGHAQTVYPIDRAEILVGARFDFKVEFQTRVDPKNIAVTLNGENYSKVLGKEATFIEREDGKDQSALILRDVSIPNAGAYKVK